MNKKYTTVGIVFLGIMALWIVGQIIIEVRSNNAMAPTILVSSLELTVWPTYTPAATYTPAPPISTNEPYATPDYTKKRYGGNSCYGINEEYFILKSNPIYNDFIEYFREIYFARYDFSKLSSSRANYIEAHMITTMNTWNALRGPSCASDYKVSVSEMMSDTILAVLRIGRGEFRDAQKSIYDAGDHGNEVHSLEQIMHRNPYK